MRVKPNNLPSYLIFLPLLFTLPTFAQQGDERLPDLQPTFDSLGALEGRASQLGDYNQAYYQLGELNPGLGDYPAGINLQTPRAALEHFLRAARDSNYREAALALNFNLLPERAQAEGARVLAQKLHYVIRQRVPINWGDLPDRPDGMIRSGPSNDATAGQPQRTINFGRLDVDGRSVQLNLQRVRAEGQPPRWVIAANTVENIEALYRVYGPSQFSRWVPAWAKQRFLGIQLWKFFGTLILGLICYFIGRLIYTILARLLRGSDAEWASDLGHKIATPVGVATGALLFYIAMNDVLSIAGGWSPYLYSLLLVVVIISLTWLIMRVIDYVIERITDTQVADVSDEDNLESRRLLTYLTVARWVITFIIVAVGIGLVIGQFPQFRNLGVSLMASAGLATVILGIAAQSTLGNIIAGLQIAITRPARIGDSIITSNGEYGTVEDIRFTYLVVKTWDSRRLVIPLKYFIDHPFQNWSMNDPHMLKPIILYADYGTDIDRIRDKFTELCTKNENFDEASDPTVQVIGADKDAIQVRCLCSAKDASTAWTLHVELREAMVTWLAGLRDGSQLARERIEVLK